MRRWNKNRIGYIHFDYSGFIDFDNFVINLLEYLQNDTKYSLLLKIQFNKDRYCMGGRQIGFKYKDECDLDNFLNLHKVWKKLMKDTLDNYDVERINSIQVLYVYIEDLPELKLKKVNKLYFNREFSNVKDNKDRFNIIPLTTNMNYYGKLVINDRLLYLSRINEQRNLLNKEDLFISDEDKIYLYKEDIIIINKKDNDNNIWYRSVYNGLSGILLGNIKDLIINEDKFIRDINNVSLTIDKDKIVKTESIKKLSYIKYNPKSLKDESNQFIGSWDIEAFDDVDGYAKVYALGFVALGEKAKVYYLDNNITSEQLVLNCLNDMLVNKYNGYTFYTHNFGRYDSTFLLKILKEENLRIGYEHYKIKEICRDNKILKLTIKVKKSLSDKTFKKPRKDPGYNTITIVDSLNILNQSLDKLCRSFDVPVVKGNFPYSFVKRETLHYVGDTPGYEYWDKDRLSLEDYNKLLKPDWNLREECLQYLEKDLVSLVLIMNKFSEYINRKYNLQVTDSLTISRLALNIFLKDYLKNTKLPIISRNMFSDIKKAYYGGVTEVYKPYGENLLHYDVNSLYPYAALNPMPGVTCSYIENFDKSIDLNSLFGFFYCEVESTNSYFGLLPVHSKEGLTMPNGKWEGWYFSEELKFASSCGYKIKVIKGYSFNKENDVFTDYVKDLYNIKCTTKDSVEKDIVKRLLNHLLGRFGLNIVKPITRCVSGDELSLIFSTRVVIGKPVPITENDYWVTYQSDIDQDVCEEHDIDYIKVKNLTPKTDLENLNEFRDVSLTTAACVTAYARIYMSKIKLHILEKGGNIYYTDTDSIVTDTPLDDNLIGNELGKFKLEYKIKQGYYISNKTYYIDLKEPIWDSYLNKYISYVIKSKTVDSKSLSLNSFKDLFNGKNVEAEKQFSIKDSYIGSVTIKRDTVNLNHDSYTKREKIYKNNMWVDTKPLFINNMDEIEGNITNNSIKKSVNTKTDKKSNHKYLKRYKFTVNFINKVLDIIGVLILTIFVVTIFIVTKEDISYHFGININSMINSYSDDDLNDLLELRYLDDYMEEPIDIEIYECKPDSWLNKLIDFLFQTSNLEIKNKNLLNNFIQETKVIHLDSNSYNERPQVLNSVLKYHIDEATKSINELSNKYFIAEYSRLKKDVLIWDALSMCKKALNGDSFSVVNTPSIENTSPIVGNKSSFLERQIPFLGGNSPFLGGNSPIVGQGEYNGFKWDSPIIR